MATASSTEGVGWEGHHESRVAERWDSNVNLLSGVSLSLPLSICTSIRSKIAEYVLYAKCLKDSKRSKTHPFAPGGYDSAEDLALQITPHSAEKWAASYRSPGPRSQIRSAG